PGVHRNRRYPAGSSPEKLEIHRANNWWSRRDLNPCESPEKLSFFGSQCFPRVAVSVQFAAHGAKSVCGLPIAGEILTSHIPSLDMRARHIRYAQLRFRWRSPSASKIEPLQQLSDWVLDHPFSARLSGDLSHHLRSSETDRAAGGAAAEHSWGQAVRHAAS